MFVTNQKLDFPRFNTKNCWCAVEAHIQNGAGSMSHVVLPLKVANTSFRDNCKQPPLRLPRWNTRNGWCSVDAHFQDGAGSVWLLLSPLKTANTSFMDGSNQLPLRLPKIQNQKSLTLHWFSFSRWGSDRAVCYFANKGCYQVGYAWQWSNHISITVLTRLVIVDALFMVILMYCPFNICRHQ